jgi:ketosteroid isomerase-like protein
MTFRETLDKHLQAIQNRDLDALVSTLPADQLVLVMSDGKDARTVREFVDAHRGWFAMPDWELRTEPLQTFETADVGVAVLRLDYSDLRPDHSRFHEYSVLTLIFARQGDRWVMVHDQNTPIRESA